MTLSGPIFLDESKNLKIEVGVFRVLQSFAILGKKMKIFQTFQNFNFFFLKSFSMCLGSTIPKGQVSCFKIDHFRAFFVLEPFLAIV